ncbi:MAG: hypothetical protein U0R78_06485 [Nocardioidaceae bacterium]
MLRRPAAALLGLASLLIAGSTVTATAAPAPLITAAVQAAPADLTCVSEGPGSPPDGLVPGTLTAPFPTQRGISLVWPLSGDANGNATAEVNYRVSGATDWTEGLPLRRALADSNEGFSWDDRLSGSLFDTAPDTTYDVQVRASDPDRGCVVQELTVHTPAIPRVPADGVVHRTGPGRLDATLAAAGPGDIVELKAGTYPGFYVDNDGTAAEPLVIRADGRVVVRGEIGLFDRKYVQVRGLVVHGRIRANNSTGVAIVGNRISGDPEGGVQAIEHSRGAYIARNTVTGPTIWRNRSVGADGDNTGEGIVVSGPGHVIERNTASGWRDCLSTMEDSEAINQQSIDFRANRLFQCADDAIEADFCFQNCRIMDNLITTSFVAMSSQPGLGGPTYFIRNRAYDILYAPYKLYRGSIGDVLLFNTTIKHGDAFNIYSGVPHKRQYARNNLFLGGPGGTYGGYSGDSGYFLSLAYDRGGSYDYDGYGMSTKRFRGVFRDQHFTGLTGLRSATTEKHGIRIGYAIFTGGMAYPAKPFKHYAPPDFSLRPGSAAAGAGVWLPGLGLPEGVAPDLGAIQVGQRPRPVGAGR